MLGDEPVVHVSGLFNNITELFVYRLLLCWMVRSNVLYRPLYNIKSGNVTFYDFTNVEQNVAYFNLLQWLPATK